MYRRELFFESDLRYHINTWESLLLVLKDYEKQGQSKINVKSILTIRVISESSGKKLVWIIIHISSVEACRWNATDGECQKNLAKNGFSVKNYVITNLPEGFFFVFPPNILKPARQIKSYFPHLSCCFIEIEKFDIFTLFVSDKEIFLSLPKLSCCCAIHSIKNRICSPI